MKTRDDEMLEAAERFHQQNPGVATEFDRITLEMIRRGYEHGGYSAVFEIIRWESGVGADGKTQFKVNNTYGPYYARVFMQKYPGHAGFFRTRKRPSKERPATGMPELSPANFQTTIKK